VSARFLRIILSVAALAGVVSCNRNSPATSKPAPESTGPVRTGTATVQGAVILSGPLPMLLLLPNQPCHAGGKPLVDESVVADSAGHLQNVIVYLEDAPPPPRANNLLPAELDQVDCHYIPHVLALRVDQTLHVTNSDATFHNVHFLCEDNNPFNFALVAVGQWRDLRFSMPENFQVRCDVHPWMKAYVSVFAHPYFSVTKQDGTFEIRDVPSGKFTLVARHEKYGELRAHVSVVDGQNVTATSFVFQSR